MPAQSDDRIRLLLDTCTIRKFLHGDLKLPLDLWRKKQHTMRLSIPDVVIAELVLQQATGALPWPVWTTKMSAINEVIDTSEPIVAGSSQLATRIGMIDFNHESIYCSIEGSKQVWDRIYCARSKRDLERPIEGGTYNIVTALEKELESRRNWWRKLIPSVVEEANAAVTAALPIKLSEKPQHETTRALIASATRFAHLIYSNRPPYNPASRQRRGDVFDFELILFAFLPAIIVTQDQRLRKHLVKAQVSVASRFLDVSDLVAWQSTDSLGKLLASQ